MDAGGVWMHHNGTIISISPAYTLCIRRAKPRLQLAVVSRCGGEVIIWILWREGGSAEGLILCAHGPLCYEEGGGLKESWNMWSVQTQLKHCGVCVWLSDQLADIVSCYPQHGDKQLWWLSSTPGQSQSRGLKRSKSAALKLRHLYDLWGPSLREMRDVHVFMFLGPTEGGLRGVKSMSQCHYHLHILFYFISFRSFIFISYFITCLLLFFKSSFHPPFSCLYLFYWFPLLLLYFYSICFLSCCRIKQHDMPDEAQGPQVAHLCS